LGGSDQMIDIILHTRKWHLLVLDLTPRRVLAGPPLAKKKTIAEL